MKNLILCFSILCSWALYSANYVFANKKIANYQIVVPDKCVGFEELAAKELQTFFNKMSESSFKIVKESKYTGQKGIFIGNTKFSRSKGMDTNKLSAETWVIKTADKDLILSGGYPIGVFYAVWDLLHKFGCYHLTFVQTAIPKKTYLALDVKDVQKKPAFNGRRIGDSTTRWLSILKSDKKYVDAYHMWMLRNGQNGGKGRDKPLWRYGAHNISHRPESHSLSLYVNPELFATNPELMRKRIAS